MTRRAEKQKLCASLDWRGSEVSVLRATAGVDPAVGQTSTTSSARNAVAKAVGDNGSQAVQLAKAIGDYSQAVQLANAAKLTGSKVAELETGLEPTETLVPHAPDLRSDVENTRHWIAGRCWRGSCAVIGKPTDRQRTAATLREMVSRTVEEVRHGDHRARAR